MLTVERGSAPVRVAAGRFFVWMSVTLVVMVIWGFGPTYFFRTLITTRELTPYIHLHGAIFVGWIALFTVQAALVATRRTPVHRRVACSGRRWPAGWLSCCSSRWRDSESR